ncbi:phytanoyl-CoA dioxygenase family protein [Streptomyces sp. NRAIS4]
MINPEFFVSDEDVKNFREHGFLKLNKIFSDELIEHMRKLSTSQITPPADNYGSGFSKLKYDIGNDDPTILSVMGDAVFVASMSKLTEQKLFFTQGLGFELEKNKSTGFPWHVGTQSFGFQRREDAGFTIWTPLCNIDADGQRGGMKYVSKKLLSGEFVYQHINLLPEYMKDQIEAGQELTYDDFSVLKNSLLNSSQMQSLLDHFAVEDSFEPGDALIFDKYVLHRSVQLGEGPIPSRLAYALRFSSIDAQYDKGRVEALAYPRITFNYDVGSDFNEKVASKDGEQVYASTYFDGSREARTLDPNHVLQEA